MPSTTIKGRNVPIQIWAPLEEVDTDVALIKVEAVEDEWSALELADAIIFGAPTYMGSASAGFKAFMDAQYRRMGEAVRVSGIKPE